MVKYLASAQQARCSGVATDGVQGYGGLLDHVSSGGMVSAIRTASCHYSAEDLLWPLFRSSILRSGPGVPDAV
jgi:hypothetical protein